MRWRCWNSIASATVATADTRCVRNFGLKVGVVGTVKFEARIKELVEDVRDLAVLVEPLLVVRRVLREQISVPLPYGAGIEPRAPTRGFSFGNSLGGRPRHAHPP
jgi:hypothetical protein